MAGATPALGFIGTGTMGAPMVRQLLAAGHRTAVWNRTPGQREALVEAGAGLAPSPAELARSSRIVILCVTDTAAVEAVVFGEPGVASGGAPDKVLVDHSSIRPAATRAMAQAGARDRHALDRRAGFGRRARHREPHTRDHGRRRRAGPG